MAKFRKYIKTDTVASSGGKCFKKLQKGQINRDAGLYDDNDVLLASWDDLIYKYGMYTYHQSNVNTTTEKRTAAYIFANNSELSNGTKLIVDPSICTDKIGDDSTNNGYAFKNCKNLKRVVVPNGMKAVLRGMFCGCTGLEDVSLSSDVSYFYSRAFEDCTSLKTIVIPDGAIGFETGVFKGCTSLEHITIPPSLTQWGTTGAHASQSIFRYCASLKNIVVPDGTKILAMYVFDGCTSLSSITLPSSITMIDYHAFAGCTALKDVYYKGTEKQWNAIDIGSGNECLLNATIHYNYGVAGLFDADDNLVASWDALVNTYGMDAGYHIYDWETNPASPYNVFKNNSELSNGTKLVITDAMTYLSAGAFCGCANLTDVVIPDSVTGMASSAFSYCTNLEFNEYDNGLYLGSESNPYRCFAQPKNTDITSCVIHENAMVFAENTFHSCKNLVSIAIPNGVAEIPNNAFYGCTSLKSITIPDSVVSIGQMAFVYCNSLTDIYYRGTEEQWDAIDVSAFNDWSKATIHYNSQ